MDAKILIVDDSESDFAIIGAGLSECNLIRVDNGLEAIAWLKKEPDIELVIIDVSQTGKDNLFLVEKLASLYDADKLRIVVLTSSEALENETNALIAGAADYIRKPLNLESLSVRLKLQLEIIRLQKKLEWQNFRRGVVHQKKSEEVIKTRDTSVNAMVNLLEARNVESGNHVMRMKEMMKILCNHLKTKDDYKELLTDSYIDELVTASPLHDIGKVAIPDAILLKPTRLNPEEFELMKKHVTFGVAALESELYRYEHVPSFITTAIELIGSHHERYDGTGYPLGLSGKDIPLSGRLMAVIDVYDALVSNRVYKPVYQFAEAVEHIRKGIGKHFDPSVAEGFLEIQDEIYTVTTAYMSSKEADNCAKDIAN